MPESYYLDTGVFVTPLLRNLAPEVIRECESWLARVASGTVSGVTSCLTWDEIVWIAGRPARGMPFDRNRAAQASRALLTHPNLRFVPVDVAVVSGAERLLDCLAPRDCIHASCALLHTAGNIVSVDRDFAVLTGSGGLRPHLIRSPAI